MLRIIILSLSFFMITSCQLFQNWQTKYPDNEAEELIEDFVKDKTDIDLDLSPVTGPERQDS